MNQNIKKHFFLQTFILIFFLFFSTIAQAKSEAAVVSANKYATEAGIKILKANGSAADAAIAMAFVLGVAEPYYSGIGGGGFLLYYEKARNQFSFIDYREVAPAGVTTADYVSTINSSEDKSASKTGGLAVAVPGFVAGMDKIHSRFGKLPWENLLQDAASLARSGYPMSNLFLAKMKSESDRLKDQKNFATFFLNPSQEKKPVLIQKNLAFTLEKIQRGGAKAFYDGTLGKLIVKELQEQGSKITLEDLQAYDVLVRKPYQFYFQDKLISTAGLPSTGGILLEQLLRAAHEQKINSHSSQFPSFLETELTKYFTSRSQLKDTSQNVLGHTTHLCVIDAEGNIAAMTNTINSAFGSGVVLSGSGIVMNNEMDDFAFDPKLNSANQIDYRNRPLSSMSPTIVFEGFDPLLVIGTPGGLTIPINLYEVLQKHLIEEEPLANAIKAPKFYTFPNHKEAFYEPGFDKKLIAKDLKVTPKVSESTVGNVQAIAINKGNLKTVSDPRGEGVGRVISLP